MAAFYLGCNRSKRSLVLDLKQPAGQRALFRLAEGADVLMHNFRPEPAARLGLSYEVFEKINPRLIYLATYGYRAAGPYGNRAAYDDIIQAGAGFASLQTAVADAPRFMPTIVADKTSSGGVLSAVLAALVASGLVAPRWSFEGFLPRRGRERHERLGRLPHAVPERRRPHDDVAHAARRGAAAGGDDVDLHDVRRDGGLFRDRGPAGHRLRRRALARDRWMPRSVKARTADCRGKPALRVRCRRETRIRSRARSHSNRWSAQW